MHVCAACVQVHCVCLCEYVCTVCVLPGAAVRLLFCKCVYNVCKVCLHLLFVAFSCCPILMRPKYSLTWGHFAALCFFIGYIQFMDLIFVQPLFVLVWITFVFTKVIAEHGMTKRKPDGARNKVPGWPNLEEFLSFVSCFSLRWASITVHWLTFICSEGLLHTSSGQTGLFGTSRNKQASYPIELRTDLSSVWWEVIRTKMMAKPSKWSSKVELNCNYPLRGWFRITTTIRTRVRSRFWVIPGMQWSC